jgi:hypothetical protein
MSGQITSVRRGLRAVAACAALLGVLAVPAVGQARAGHASPERQVLSRPGYRSTWAYLESATDAYASPSRRARVLGYLGTTTQDGTSELLFEQQRMRVNGAWWVQVRLPLRPAGQIGWVPQRVLGAPQTVHTYLVVSTETTTLAFGTSALSNVETDWPGGGVIGIHGTNEPSLIPGHPSHGCIRVPNWEIVKLARLLPIGTPLTIE